MIKESIVYKNNICLFTTLIGRKKNFLEILEYLKGIDGLKLLETTEFLQGKMIRWGICWSYFFDEEDFFTKNPLIENKDNLKFRYSSFK